MKNMRCRKLTLPSLNDLNNNMGIDDDAALRKTGVTNDEYNRHILENMVAIFYPAKPLLNRY